MSATASASPSLALIKYWGKEPGGVNLPATSSLAVTLDELRTTTTVAALPASADDCVVVNDCREDAATFKPVIDLFRERSHTRTRLQITSTNDFPTAAGLASSSSGFAALVLALDRFFDTGLSREELSAAARQGSGSAARAVYGGYTFWRAGTPHAEPLLPADHWPDLRVIVTVLSSAAKPVSSRAGMGRTAATSPIYEQWCRESESLFDKGTQALRRRDLEALGTVMRESYLMMFSTMFTARPPLIYWLPASLAIIHEAEALRGEGIPVWETMDAGPQVKLLTLAQHVDAIRERLTARVPECRLIVARAGGEPVAERSHAHTDPRGEASGDDR